MKKGVFLLSVFLFATMALNGCSSPDSPNLPNNGDAGSDSSTTADAGPPFSYLPTTYDSNGYFHLSSDQSAYVGYTPSIYTPALKMSLFVWMHGCGGLAEDDLSIIAPATTRESQSYIAISIGGREGDCWDVSSDSPKVLSAIADAKKHFNLNPQKIYIGGYSSGGDLAYRVGLQNPGMFAGLLVEDSAPFLNSGITAASVGTIASPVHVAHLAHLEDATYPIGNVLTELATLKSKGYIVTILEAPGSHYDTDAPAANPTSGTSYGLRTLLLPYLDAGWTASR